MTPEWSEWCSANGFVCAGNSAERAWAHSDGFGYVTLRLAFGRDDGRASASIIASGSRDCVGIATVDQERAAKLAMFLEECEYR